MDNIISIYLYIDNLIYLQIKNFKDYVELFVKDKTDDMDVPIKVVHEVVNPRWEVAVTISDKGYQHVSFVNSIATSKVSLLSRYSMLSPSKVAKKK